MANLSVNSLANLNVYLAGTSLLGRAAEIKIPQPKGMRADYRGLGMFGKLKIPTGMEALEGSIKWSSFDSSTLSQLSVVQMSQFSALGDLQTLTAAGEVLEQPVIYNFTGMPLDIGPITAKAQELVEYTTTLDVYHVELYIGGELAYLYDVFSNQYVVGGVDQLATFRANTGN
jgi:P2 family phage contractile tail tube protein